MTTVASVQPPLPPNARPRWREAMELLSSMRFAISLLTVICVVSAIGTVLRQGEPLVNYVDQFGPFWADVFGALGLFRIYSTPWFLAILAFLVLSTSLCIARNTPRILADWRTHKEYIREQALNAFHHHANGTLAMPLARAQAEVSQLLSSSGWTLKSQVRQGAQAHGGLDGVMLGARHGAANKLGYIAAHSAIVLVCIGGLFDGDLIVKVQAWAQGLQPFRGGAVTERSHLSLDNPAYRAQLFVAEGQRSSSAVLNLEQGMLIQPLPFDLELKKFVVDYYATGMPKRFASEIVIHDPAQPGKPRAATIEVNHPLTYKGVTIFQSSFEDGGSLVRLKPLHLTPAANQGRPAEPGLVEGVVNGEPQSLPVWWWTGVSNAPPGEFKLEITGLRVINVEDLGGAKSDPTDAPAGASATAGDDVRGVNLAELTRHLGSGAKAPGDKKLVNVGPSVTYKLRDAAGQAREYQNYMAPVTIQGQTVFLLGVRDTPADRFRYLRVPADENFQIDGWARLRQALADPGLRHEAAERFARLATPGDHQELTEQLSLSAHRALDLFSGAQPGSVPASKAASQPMVGGLQALSAFIEQVVPEPERERTSETLIRILNGALFQLLNVSRERAGLKPLSSDDEPARNFLTQAVLSLSDAAFYPAPVVLTLDGFEQKQASVFQVTRTPGRNVVYLGCVLLIVGVFAMLYIRERRLWVWLQDDGQGGTRLRMALSSTRHTLDIDREFDRLRAALLPAHQG